MTEDLGGGPLVFQGIACDQKCWWLMSGKNTKSDREMRRFFMSNDRGKRGVRKKRFG